MPASDYQHKPGGSLKLKGAGGAVEPSKKKKKKSSASKKARDEDRDAPASASGSGQERSQSPAVGGSGGSTSVAASGKTEAQRRFEEVQRKRLLEKAAKAAVKSHKERVAEFNEKLENLSEHYDIPKVGPG
ncbi:hypothetical protein JCM3775_000437 [Rhodotorula graminis]|uniref:DUF1754-domain-containing protein n=1 Tax=Rhodotorula graminis (strain WP1) TaxID=578459 RepID=A0A194SA57_RHOGW|nr:uncharacterized protein RHOBADRAFT_41461 [Rhodotorula graminis WP1]KPV77469.1 hypothetical protein RHOBADRAFT_41461 [Rhodotorula graminis WP1]